MFFKKKPPPPVKKPAALPPPAPVRSAKEKAEDDMLYQKILQAFVEIQNNRGQSIKQITHTLEKNKK
jgi:hypothetical protein